MFAAFFSKVQWMKIPFHKNTINGKNITSYEYCWLLDIYLPIDMYATFLGCLSSLEAVPTKRRMMKTMPLSTSLPFPHPLLHSWQCKALNRPTTTIRPLPQLLNCTPTNTINRDNSRFANIPESRTLKTSENCLNLFCVK